MFIVVLSMFMAFNFLYNFVGFMEFECSTLIVTVLFDEPGVAIAAVLSCKQYRTHERKAYFE